MFYATLDGVPGIRKDDSKNNFQSVDRLVDVMLGENFGFMVIAHPVSIVEIHTIENDLYPIYDMISFAAKQSIQYGTNQGEQTGSSNNYGISDADTETYGDAKGTNSGGNKGFDHSKSTHKDFSHSKSNTDQTNREKAAMVHPADHHMQHKSKAENIEE